MRRGSCFCVQIPCVSLAARIENFYLSYSHVPLRFRLHVHGIGLSFHGNYFALKWMDNTHASAQCTLNVNSFSTREISSHSALAFLQLQSKQAITSGEGTRDMRNGETVFTCVRHSRLARSCLWVWGIHCFGKAFCLLFECRSLRLGLFDARIVENGKL